MQQQPKYETKLLFKTDRGRYVWDPILQLVEYYDKGSQRARRTIPLDINQNWYDGALRAIARDILKTTKAGGING